MPLAGEGRVEKRFRVAREGQTVDGRELTRQEIQDMAETYNPEHYAGRINIEHFAGWSPEPPFNAYGDIIKVEAVEEGGKLCLYNTISALPNFVAMNKKGQKIYPSIEFYRNFAGTNRAYQVGLGMTDTPASLGTQAVKFSSTQFAVRTQPNAEIFMSLTAPTDQDNSVPNDQKGFLEQLKTLLTPSQPKIPAQPDDFQAVVTQGVVAALKGIQDLNEKFSKLSVPPATAPAPAPAPAQQATTAAAPVEQSVPGANDHFSQALAPVLLSIQGIQTQINQLSTTAVNLPPASSGGDTDQVSY
ncbi:GPO family capsid scaffolding protein [Acinetobacter chinensis]|uniref:GPO family capsid scaffolding protein n=1 Tax=Acinetobacter chinensis TaxID=2004650 RepID=A0ABU3WHH2_9GAMM|nr:GPO family capsid scaffolding protein [Acinetobacter chinensis]MDV2469845.1 GPO family capsid scaffolding protein [Acinetobacter chinensis]